MSHYTQTQIDNMSTYEKFQLNKYGDILPVRDLNDELENGMEERQRQTDIVNQYWEMEIMHEESNF